MTSVQTSERCNLCHTYLSPVTKLDFKQPLEIIKYPDPRLRAMNAKIAVFDDSLKTLAKEMIRLMYL